MSSNVAQALAELKIETPPGLVDLVQAVEREVDVLLGERDNMIQTIRENSYAYMALRLRSECIAMEVHAPTELMHFEPVGYLSQRHDFYYLDLPAKEQERLGTRIVYGWKYSEPGLIGIDLANTDDWGIEVCVHGAGFDVGCEQCESRANGGTEHV
jgi:hypothetical protein